MVSAPLRSDAALSGRTPEFAMKYTCPICGYKTLEARFEWEICPVCFWEDDVIADNDPSSPANGELRVSEAQANFMIFKSCSKQHRFPVREPLPDEERDTSWRPLPEAIRLAELLLIQGQPP
jgi:hypothetical protein